MLDLKTLIRTCEHYIIRSPWTLDNGNEIVLPAMLCNDIMRTLKELEENMKAKELLEDCENCKEYDADNHYCIRFCNVIRTTIEELKSARVMEIEEVYDCNEGDCLWLEVKGEFCGNALYISSSIDNYVDMRSATHRFSNDPVLYLKYWRVWTKEPTIEQRVEVEWNA